MLRLYNDLTQALEPFLPRDAAASLYICGITPYDTTHLGHAFTYCSFDVLVRYLEWLGLAVHYVQNVTDVDDDILRRARETGENWLTLGNRWVRRYVDDMEGLNVRPPDLFPRASGAISGIIEVVGSLVAQGYAYARGGSVYYRSAFAPFGSLSHLPASDWLAVAGERGNIADDPNKESPLDFVLWQAQAPGEPAWPSPWGPGRPGWHIECSTLGALCLGASIDIHGGGSDLAFPHHESEIAQAESYTGQRPFARYWLHTGMLRYQGAKMSKSLGNLVMVCSLLQDHSADALRLYLSRHHYRDSWEYDEGDLAQAESVAARWRAAAEAGGAAAGAPAPAPWRARFQAAMDDDLDTPRVVAVLDELATEAPRHPGAAGLREMAGVLGLRLGLRGPEPRAIEGWEAHKACFRHEEVKGAGNGRKR